MRIVPAVEPDFGALGRRIDERTAHEALQAAGPFDVLQAPFDALLAAPASADAPKRGDGERGVGDLMTADELRHRQIEQTFRILIDHAAVLVMRAIVLAVDIEAGAQLIGAARDHLFRLFGLRPDDAGHGRA